MRQQISQSLYDEQLAVKVHEFKKRFQRFFQEDPDIYASAIRHFRSRAEFRVWHDGDDLFHIMFDQATKEKYRVDQFPIANETINALMHRLLDEIKTIPVLRRKLFQIDYLSGISGEIVISLLYHKPLCTEWKTAIATLKSKLSIDFEINFVGRARKQKELVDNDFIIEKLPIKGKEYLFKHVENSFTQPNAKINCDMIEWALEVTSNTENDLLELYCGAGNFSLPMAQNFRRVVATEISRTSVDAAQYNISVNRIDNVDILRMSSEEFSDAYLNGKQLKRLENSDLASLNVSTVLVDPPRAGLDSDTVKMISRFDNIVYISCNPETLEHNLDDLAETHEVKRLALFDQFPYTHHIESGVFLTKR